MDRTRTMPRLSLILTAVLTLSGATLRSVCMLTQFDAKVGYFNRGPLPTLSNILYFVAILVAMIGAALIQKGSLPEKLDTRLRLPASFLWGISLVAFTVGTLLLCLAERTGNMVLAPIALGLPASAYFFVSADRSGRYPDWLSLLGFLPVLWCIAAVGETYVDQFTAMNSPIKVGLQMGFIGLALILISELRFRLGKPLPRAAVALVSIGVFLSLNAAIPVLLATGAHILDNKLHLFYAIVLLCGGLYGLYTLFQYTWFPAEEEDTPDAEESEVIPSSDEAAPASDSPADTSEPPNAE